MKPIFFLCFIISLLFPVIGDANEKSPQEPSHLPCYKIGLGDQLFISVWRDEALTRRSIVLPDGTISFPLIGEVIAVGKTVEDLKNELSEKISKYVPDPRLSVEIQQVNSLLIYVIGRVNKPGQFLLNGNVTVIQALAMAGGLNPFADDDEIRILREIGNQTRVIQFNYEEVSKGKNLEQNILLERGDVIIVP